MIDWNQLSGSWNVENVTDRQTTGHQFYFYKWIAYKLSETTTGDMFFLNEEMNVNGA